MAKQKVTVKHDVSHRFVCEHCGDISEWKNSTIEGNTKEEIFEKKIPGILKEIEKNNYSDLIKLDGKCGKCNKRQSWEIVGSTKIIKRAPGIGLMAAGSLGWFAWFLFGLLGFLVVFAVVTLFALIYGSIDYIRVNSDMKATSQRNTPEINWMYMQTEEIPAEPKTEI